MARKKKKYDSDQEAPGLPMTPMIDIVFLLLIFFMLSSKFRTIEGKLKAYLPKDRGQGVSTPTIDLGEMRVKLLWADQSGNIYPLRKLGTSFPDYFERVKNGKTMLKVGDRVFPEVESGWPDYRLLFQHIVEAMKDYKAPSFDTGKTMPLIIDAREPVQWKHPVAVLNAAMKAGLSDLTFAAPEIPY